MRRVDAVFVACFLTVGALSGCGAARPPLASVPGPASTVTEVAAATVSRPAVDDVRDYVQAYLATRNDFDVVLSLKMQQPNEMLFPFTGSALNHGQALTFSGVYDAATKAVTLHTKPAA